MEIEIERKRVNEPVVVHLSKEEDCRRIGPCRGRNSHHSDCIVIKDCWDVFGRELIGSVTDEKTSLSNCTVADDHTSSHNKVSTLTLTFAHGWLLSIQSG